MTMTTDKKRWIHVMDQDNIPWDGTYIDIRNTPHDHNMYQSGSAGTESRKWIDEVNIVALRNLMGNPDKWKYYTRDVVPIRIDTLPFIWFRNESDALTFVLMFGGICASARAVHRYADPDADEVSK